jgi:hypothetical protein
MANGKEFIVRSCYDIKKGQEVHYNGNKLGRVENVTVRIEPDALETDHLTIDVIIK